MRRLKTRWHDWWRVRAWDVAALSVIVICFGLMFVPSLVRGQFPLVADSFCYSLPLRAQAFGMLRGGAWPLWTHELLAGYPLLSMAQVAVGYPLTWGYLLLPARWAETLYVLAPYLLAPAFTYAYCREVGRTRMAALVAALAFGYGGLMFSKYTNNGMIPNAVMWLPLILIALERARRGRFAACLLGATCAYALAVLSGIGQGFVFAGVLALAYALFLGLARPELADQTDARARGWRSWPRWRPLAVMLVALGLAAGVAAFQILETMRAARLSVRSVLSYDTFGEGSLTFRTVWRSLLLTFYAYDAIDVAAYVAPLALALALCGVALTFGNQRRDVRVFFWLTTAAAAFVLMLGAHTPLYRIVYYVPVLNRFRVPARHAFEWSFALSVLAAYGWDALATVCADRKESALNQKRALAAGLLVVALAGALSVYWWRAMGRPETPYQMQYVGLPESSYLLLRAAHTLLVVVGLMLAWRIAAHRWRVGLSVALLLVACLTEPFILLTSWWLPLHKTARQLTTPSMATRYLQQFPTGRHRVYTRINLFQEQPAALARIDPHNLTVLYSLYNVAGYEPLILERYSRALGNVGVDSVNPRLGFPRDDNLFAPRSRVLDLLNTTFVVGYANLAPSVVGGGSKEGIDFPAADLGVGLAPGESVTLHALEVTGDALAVVTSLSHATDTEDDSPVARLRVFGVDGRAFELSLLAGRDTAEWAHERADVRATIKHRRAPVFDQTPADAADSFAALRYWARLPLGARTRIARVEITNLSQSATLALWKAVIFDAAGQTSGPLVTERAYPVALSDTERWARAYNQDNVLILRNARALGSAWLVSEAEAVDGEEALRRIRGEGGAAFDPLRTALVEIQPAELPRLPGSVGRYAVTEVAYTPNGIEIETSADDAALLVVSETSYPGWAATVDGQPAPVYTTDFILQSVPVPAGRHRVSLRYTAPAARIGAIISLLTLLLLGALTLYSRRRKA